MAKEKHVHHWDIEPAMASTSMGRCRKCGEEKVFYNSIWSEQAERDRGMTEEERKQAERELKFQSSVVINQGLREYGPGRGWWIMQSELGV